MAVIFYHEQWGGLSLPRKQLRIKEVEKMFKRALAEAENHARVRRPLTWEIIRVVEENIGEWGIGGRIGRIGQALTNQLLLRATGLFAEEGRKLHEGLLLEEGRYGLLREIKCSWGPGNRNAADTAGIRFNGVKGTRGEKGR